MNLTKRNRNKVYDYISDNGTFTTRGLKNKFRTVSYEEFHNSIGRFVRRMEESGYLSWKAPGKYSLTSRGRRFVNSAF